MVDLKEEAAAATKTGRRGVATKFQCPLSNISSSNSASSTSTASPSGPHAVWFFLSLDAPSQHSTTGIPDPRTRAETLLWFRAEIERNKHLADTVSASA